MVVTTLTPRTGPSGKAVPYDPAGVKLMANGRTRLTATKTRSAGLLGPRIDGPCMIEVVTTGRLCALHPLAVFAIWLYDDDTKDELDIIEATWWGDPNSPNLYHQTEYLAGDKVREHHASARSFDRHKFTCEVTKDGRAVCRVFGWQFDKWLDIMAFSAPFKPGQLRIGLWTHQGIKDALGPCSVVLERVAVTPL